MRTLVLGGARSGKSAYAEGLFARGPVRYVATAVRTPDDAAWDARIDAHRARRPTDWETVETPDLVGLLSSPNDGVPWLVDDLGTWLTAELDAAQAWNQPPGIIAARCSALIDAVTASAAHLVLVSPEVGMGVIPSTASGRLFRDELGALNAALAAACDEVQLVVAGIPLKLKGPQ